MRKLVCLSLILFGFSTANAPKATAQQLPIWDPINWGLSIVIKKHEEASRVIRNVVLPLKRSISEVSKFFKKSKEQINTIVKNLALAKDIIELEPVLEKSFFEAHHFIRDAEHLQPRIQYYQYLSQLWWRYRDVLEVFKLSYDRNKSLMNDEQRIRLMDETYKKMLKINGAFKAVHRRNFKIEMTFRNKKHQIETYKKFFSNYSF